MSPNLKMWVFIETHESLLCRRAHVQIEGKRENIRVWVSWRRILDKCRRCQNGVAEILIREFHTQHVLILVVVLIVSVVVVVVVVVVVEVVVVVVVVEVAVKW